MVGVGFDTARDTTGIKCSCFIEREEGRENEREREREREREKERERESDGIKRRQRERVFGGGGQHMQNTRSKFTLHCLTELVSLFEGPASDRGASIGSCC